MLLDELYNDLEALNPSLTNVFDDGISRDIVAEQTANLPILIREDV